MRAIKIKTREALRNIKPVDRAGELANKTKGGASSLNRSAEQTQNVGYESETEYAGNEVQDKEERIGKGILSGANRIGKWGVRETRRNIQKWRNRPKKLKVNTGKELPAPKRPMLTEGAKKGAKTAGKGAKTASKGAKQAGKAAKQAAKGTAKTAKASAKAAKAAAKATKASVKASVKLAQLAKKAIMAAIKFAKVAVKATITAVKAIIAGVKALVAAIAAGGWVAVLIIVIIVIVALIAGSVYAIFVPADENAINVYNVMSELDREQAQKEQDLLANCQYDVLSYDGNYSKWNEVIAVYAVKMNLDAEDPQDVVIFNEDKSNELRKIYQDMNSVTIKTESREQEIKKLVTDENGEVKEVTEIVTIVYATVVRTPTSISDISEQYNFTEYQIDMLTELLDEKNAELWQGLLTPVQ